MCLFTSHFADFIGIRKNLLDEIISCFIITVHPQNMLFTSDMLQNNQSYASVLSTNAESPFYICRLLEALANPVTYKQNYFIAHSTNIESDDISCFIESNNIFAPGLRLLNLLRESYFPFSLIDLDLVEENDIIINNSSHQVHYFSFLLQLNVSTNFVSIQHHLFFDDK